jgi:hypothetical protein
VQNSFRKTAVTGVNKFLGLVGLEVAKVREQDWRDPRTFIPFDETIRAAADAGVSVGQYIDATYNVPGVNEATTQRLEQLGILSGDVERVLELGPGSGRYLERVTALCRPAHYEIYETAAPWAKWLVESYGVTLRPTDGRSLAATPTGSVDLAHAHKVMCVLPFLTICRYLVELMRVTRVGGVVVFDVPTEECMGVETVRAWVDSDVDSGPYPSFLARQLVLDNFGARGFELLDTFRMPMIPGETEYFVFRRTAATDAPASGSITA